VLRAVQASWTSQCTKTGPPTMGRHAGRSRETSCPRIDHSDKSLIMACRACRATAAHVRIFRYRLRSGASQTALGPLWHQARMHWFIPVMPGKSGVLRIWVWGGKSWVRMTAQTSRVAGSVALTKPCRNEEDLGRLLRGPRAHPWLPCGEGTRSHKPAALKFDILAVGRQLGKCRCRPQKT
jgi:hypothetical protein